MILQGLQQQALALDASDTLATYKQQFYFPQVNGNNAIYFCGPVDNFKILRQEYQIRIFRSLFCMIHILIRNFKSLISNKIRIDNFVKLSVTINIG